MSRYYSDPSRAADTYALPDVEVFYVRPEDGMRDEAGCLLGPGWYYWFCFPGCLPDSEPSGPYKSEEAALAAAQEEAS